MSGTAKKWIAVAGGVLVAVASSLLVALPNNHSVHVACEVALAVLGGLGLTAPVSIMNPAPADKQ